MIVLKKKAKICIGIILFLAISAAGVLVEHFEKDAFVVETVVTDDVPSYVSESESEIDGKININSADIEQLVVLKGIGEATAKKIIAYREENGPFVTIEEIMKVPGIGENKFEDIKDFICAE